MQRLRDAGYTVLNRHRHEALGEIPKEDLESLSELDLGQSDFALIVVDSGKAMLWPTSDKVWLKSFPTIESAVAYLIDRARDDDPQMVPELF